jgi:hypothetical protein
MGRGSRILRATLMGVGGGIDEIGGLVVLVGKWRIERKLEECQNPTNFDTNRDVVG